VFLNSARCNGTRWTCLKAVIRRFLLAENQLWQPALDGLKLGGVDERVDAVVEE